VNSVVANRIKAPGPKKILACDGGGIRGLMSVEILAKLEADLRAKLGKPNLVLADWFDFVCGTSTGAIIATCISAGMSVDQIRQFYLDSGKEMFEKASLLKRLQYKYEDEPLALKLKEALGASSTLGSDKLRTVLMMVMRNATTDSPWPLSNNPFARYNQPERGDCNLQLPLWQLVRASTAAPTYFPPEVVTLGKAPKAYSFIFVDGGVTTYNNPAFLAFEMATAAPYAMNWATGEDKLLIVSVGTGNAADARPDLRPSQMNLIDSASRIPGALMNAATAGWDMACRVLGDCRFGPAIDREFGTMIHEPGAAPNFTGAKQFAYVRYDADLSQEGLNGLGLNGIKAEDVQMLDSVDHIPQIRQVGQAYGARHVSLAHLRGFV
jgi:patatin-like phospholipase/acyl hydrolase